MELGCWQVAAVPFPARAPLLIRWPRQVRAPCFSLTGIYIQSSRVQGQSMHTQRTQAETSSAPTTSQASITALQACCCKAAKRAASWGAENPDTAAASALLTRDGT